jgi:hypothetical protein
VEEDGGWQDAAEGNTTTAWQRASNYGLWWRSNDGTKDNDNKTKINICVVAEAEDNNGWQEATDEQQWRSGQATAVSGGGATTALTATTTKQQSTKYWQQRQRTMTTGKRRIN